MAPETRKTTMDSLEDQIRALTQQMEALIRRQDDQNQINHNQNQLLNKRLDEQSRKHDEIITQLQKSLDESAVERSQHTSQPLQQIPTETRISAETGNNCVLKPLSFSPKIECPKFDGTNPRNWIDKCGRYFELCKVLEYQKVDIASLYMIGKAEDWMCSYMSNRRGVCWNEFVDDLFGRFRDESGTEVVEQFNKLCQSGDLDTYVDEFEHYKSVMKQHNHVLPDAYLLDSFIGGLKPAVRPFVRAFKPVSITQAIRYARLQEETLLVSKNTEMFPLIFKPALSNIKPPILPTPELFDESPKKEKLWQQYANNGMQGQVGEGEAVHLTLEVLNAISQEERKKALRRLRLNVLIFDPGGLSFVSELVQVRAVAVMGGLLHISLFMCLCGITASFCGSKPSEGVFVGAFLTGLLLAETEFPLQLSFLLFFVVCISMALTLWLAAGSQLIASHFEQPDVRSLLPVESMTDDLQDHIIMCGFGRVGQIIAQLLSERLIPFVTLDVRSDRVAVGRALDLPVYFGDAGSREMLHKVGANNGWQGSLTTGSLNFKNAARGNIWEDAEIFADYKFEEHDITGEWLDSLVSSEWTSETILLEAKPWWELPKRWVIVLLYFTAFLLCNMDGVNMSIAILPLSKESNWSSVIVGLIQSSSFWGYLLTQILGGIWADKVGGKLVLHFGVVWWLIAMIMTPIAAEIGLPFLFIMCAFMGIGEGVAMPAMNNILTKCIHVSERSRFLALVYSGMYLGSVTGLSLSPALIHKFGWSSVFHSFDSLGSLWFALWLSKTHNSPREDPELSAEEKRLILGDLFMT